MLSIFECITRSSSLSIEETSSVLFLFSSTVQLSITVTQKLTTLISLL